MRKPPMGLGTCVVPHPALRLLRSRISALVDAQRPAVSVHQALNAATDSDSASRAALALADSWAVKDTRSLLATLLEVVTDRQFPAFLVQEQALRQQLSETLNYVRVMVGRLDQTGELVSREMRETSRTIFDEYTASEGWRQWMVQQEAKQPDLEAKAILKVRGRGMFLGFGSVALMLVVPTFVLVLRSYVAFLRYVLALRSCVAFLRYVLALRSCVAFLRCVLVLRSCVAFLCCVRCITSSHCSYVVNLLTPRLLQSEMLDVVRRDLYRLVVVGLVEYLSIEQTSLTADQMLDLVLHDTTKLQAFEPMTSVHLSTGFFLRSFWQGNVPVSRIGRLLMLLVGKLYADVRDEANTDRRQQYMGRQLKLKRVVSNVQDLFREVVQKNTNTDTWRLTSNPLGNRDLIELPRLLEHLGIRLVSFMQQFLLSPK